MLTTDHINALFELAGAAFVWLNVYTIYQHKYVAGVTFQAAAVFMLWGFWNLFYYPHLGQYWSAIAAIILALGNAAWFVLAIYYSRSAKW